MHTVMAGSTQTLRGRELSQDLFVGQALAHQRSDMAHSLVDMLGTMLGQGVADGR